jgi:hypothetical protein
MYQISDLEKEKKKNTIIGPVHLESQTRDTAQARGLLQL